MYNKEVTEKDAAKWCLKLKFRSICICKLLNTNDIFNYPSQMTGFQDTTDTDLCYAFIPTWYRRDQRREGDHIT